MALRATLLGGIFLSSHPGLAHATSPFKEAEITATRCNSFWLTANVSLFMG